MGSRYNPKSYTRSTTARKQAYANVSSKARYTAASSRRRATAAPMRDQREPGYVDLAASAFNFSTTGTIALIATVPQGVSVNQRVGKKIIWKSIQIRGQSISGTTTTVADCAMIIVYDRRPTGALPAITDILDSANSSAFNNDANSGRFQILKRLDFCHSGNSTTPTTGAEIIDLASFTKLKGQKGVFKVAATGAIADYEEGALYCVTVGSNVAGTTAPQGTIAFRTRFLDV